MASIKNLSRIHEIAESLPKLEEARKLLSKDESEVIVGIPPETVVILPKGVKWNMLNIINLEINKQKEELTGL